MVLTLLAAAAPGPCEAVKGPAGDGGEIKERSSTGATLTRSDRR